MRCVFTAQAGIQAHIGTKDAKWSSPGFTPPIKFTTGTPNFNGNRNLVVKYAHTE